MNEEQTWQEKHQRYVQKLRTVIKRECDGSRMNDTKWLKLFDALRDLPLQYRVKFVDMDGVTPWSRVIVVAVGDSSQAPVPYIEGQGYSPELVLALEWLEINPVQRLTRGLLLPDEAVDHTPEVERRLQAAHVSCTQEGSFLRVTGHVRKPGAPSNQV